MKARMIRDAEQLNPKWSHETAARFQKAGKRYPHPYTIPIAKGAIVDHPDAHKLVKQGMAIPADDECKEACGLTEDQIQECIMAQTRMQEEDFMEELTGEPAETEEEDDEEEE
jgi:hypothetical protein